MTGYRLFCLGNPRLELDGRPVKQEMRKALALLIYLCVIGRDCSREYLATLFWPEYDQRHAQANLRRTLASLNKSLRTGILEADREKIGFRDPASIWLDVEEFLRLISSGRNHPHPHDKTCPECLSAIENAVQLYQGDFLEGFNLNDCPEFDEWQFLQRENLRLEFAQTLKMLSDGLAYRLQWEAAIAYARRWVALDRLNEPAQRQLISLYAQAGQRSAALRQCDEIERLLKIELNQALESETIELIREIQVGDIATPKAGPPASPIPVAAPSTSEPLLKSKLYIPFSRSERVTRPRLIRLFNEIEDHPVTLLSAPAGFGKTTALTEWVLQSQLPVGWVSLDSSDNDPFRFLAYLIAALESIQSLGEVGFPGMLHFSQSSSLHTVLVTLIHALEQSAATYVVVFDDYQFIDSSHVHDLVAFMLEHLPSGMHLVISSRADPPFPLARLRAGRQLLEIRTDDLRFTLEEAGTFLNQVMGLQLSPEEIASLDQRTEGWIVGLQLAAHSLKDLAEPSRFVQAFSGSHRYILDYLVEEVLGRQAALIQDFLLQTSILTRLSGPLCDAVTGVREWQIENLPRMPLLQTPVSGQDILEYLDRINLFLIPLDDERLWYRYHHLFADLLQARLRQAHPERLAFLHRRAADWYGENGYPLDAVRHTLASKDETHAAGLVEKFAEKIIRDGGFSTVLGWMKSLSRDLIQRRPWLCVWYSWALLQSGVSDGVDSLICDAENALQSLMNQPPGLNSGEIQAIKDQVISLQATVASQSDDHERTIALSLQALTQIQEDKDWQRINILYILGKTNYILGNLSEAEDYYRQTRAIAERIGFFIRYILSTYRLARIQHMRGDLHQAYDIYQECLSKALNQHHEKDLGMGFIYTGSGEILYEWNRLEEAQRMILEGVKVDELTMVPPILANSYNLYARLLIRQGDLDAARTVLQKVKDLVAKYPMSPDVSEVNEACWVRLWLAVGDLSSANEWARGRRTLPSDSGWFSRMQGEVATVRLMIAGNQYQLAGKRLEQLADVAESGGWLDRLIEIRILQALDTHASGLNDEALDYLGESLRLAEPHGYVSVYVDEGTPVKTLLKVGLLQEKWTAPEIKRYVDDLMRAFNYDRSKQYNI